MKQPETTELVRLPTVSPEAAVLLTNAFGFAILALDPTMSPIELAVVQLEVYRCVKQVSRDEAIKLHKQMRALCKAANPGIGSLTL